MTAIAPTLMLAFLLALSLPGMCDPTTGFSGVTGMTLTCTRSTGANEAIAVNAPQSVGFSIKVNGKADAKLRGDVALTRLNGPRYEWKSYFTSTDAAGSKTVTTSFPGGGTIPNAVGSYKFQASLRQRDGTTITSNIITVIVYKVQCVKIEATHNEKIFWPTTPHFDDRLWVADSRVFAETGNLKVVFDRKRVADIMRPSPQYYRLNFTLQRYPACNTSQKLVTEVSVISTGPPRYDSCQRLDIPLCLGHDEPQNRSACIRSAFHLQGECATGEYHSAAGARLRRLCHLWQASLCSGQLYQ